MHYIYYSVFKGR